MRLVRFRIVFWLVVVLGVAPSLASGIALAPHFLPETICAPLRPIATLSEYTSMVRWERVHSFGRAGVMIAGVLVMGYAAAWAWEAGISRRWRRALVAALTLVLLPSLAAALWTGRALPWHALGPSVSLGEEMPTVIPGRAPEEAAGPAYCLDHAAEVRHLVWAWIAHVAAGALAVALTLAFADLAARWRTAKSRAG
jgi:hypothetical protein